MPLKMHLLAFELVLTTTIQANGSKSVASFDSAMTEANPPTVVRSSDGYIYGNPVKRVLRAHERTTDEARDPRLSLADEIKSSGTDRTNNESA